MSLLCLLGGLVVAVATSNALVSLPLKRESVNRHEGLNSRGGTPIALSSKMNVYTTTIQIGSDQQDFTVVVDTGSTNLFVPSSSCKTCGGTHQFTCRNQRAQSVSIAYVTGEGRGNVCADTVTVGNYTVQNQEFIVMEAEDGFLQEQKFDGILGMSYKSIIPSYTTRDSPWTFRKHYMVPVFQNLVQQTGVKNVYSLYLTLDHLGESRVFLGGSEPQYYEGNLQYVNVIPSYMYGLYVYSEFNVEMNSFTYNGYQLLRGPVAALIDSGTSSISIPVSVFQSLNVSPSIQCDQAWQLPLISLRLGNYEISFEGKDYVRPFEEHSNVCVVDFSSNMDYWILGEPFFRKTYVEFDLNRNVIGLAKSKQPPSQEDTTLAKTSSYCN